MADRYAIVRVEPSEEMWRAGREPIMARDCVREGWSVAQHVNEAYGGPPAWLDPETDNLGYHVSKGTCAVWTYRAMLASRPPVAEEVVEEWARVVFRAYSESVWGATQEPNDVQSKTACNMVRALLAHINPTEGD